MYNFDIVRLRNLIKGSKLNVGEIATKSGIKRATLYNYLNETTQIPVEALISIFNVINFNLNEVIKVDSNNLELNSDIPNVPIIAINKNDGKLDDIIDDKPNVPKMSSMETGKKQNMTGLKAHKKGDTNEYDLNPFNLRTDVLMDHQKIPIYSMEAAAGIITVFSDLKNSNVIDYMDVPKAPKCDGAIYASGDSMYELIKSGDLLGYKYIKDLPEDIYWGHIYILAIDMAGEEMVTVKFVQRGKDDDHIKLISQNKNHQEKEIHISKIRSMALVKLTLRYNTMN